MEGSSFFAIPTEQKYSENYVISQILPHHQGTVRALALNSSGFLLSGSLDKTLKLWKYDGQTQNYIFEKNIEYHHDYIYSICGMQDGQGFFSGGGDKKIFAIDNVGNPLAVFEGHDGPVCSLSQSSSTVLVSGSWDGTARVWDIATGKTIHTLADHKYGVCVLALPNGNIFTSSQDGLIRLWNNGKLFKQWQAHSEIVRQLASVSDFGIVSCSNDQSIKIWSHNGDLIQEMNGHEGFVFCVDILPNGDIVSGSDDKTVKVWRDSYCIETIEHPDSVWTIHADQDNNIITGSEDKKIRIFTKNISAQADKETIEELENENKVAREAKKLDLANLPSVDQLSKVKGRKEGEIKVFKKGNGAEAYSWKYGEQKWELIGDVMMPEDKSNSQATKIYEGDRVFAAGEYDHIFDIEMGDGVLRKLPFNNGDNALVASEKFVARENFSKIHIPQIVDWIKKNSVNVPTRNTQSDQNTKKQVYKTFPMKEYIYFNTVNLAAPQKKIMEFNDALLKNEAKKDYAMTENEITHFNRLVATLNNQSNYHSSKFSENEILLLTKKLLKWPIDNLFPILDLFRIFLMHPRSSIIFKTYESGLEYIYFIFNLLSERKSEIGNAGVLLCLRSLVNFFSQPSSHFIMTEKVQNVIDCIVDHLFDENKNIRQAIYTIFLNYSIAFMNKNDLDSKIQVITALCSPLQNENDLNNNYRILVTLGNLMYDEEEAKTMAKNIGILEVLKNRVELRSKDSNVETAKNELLNLINN